MQRPSPLTPALSGARRSRPAVHLASCALVFILLTAGLSLLLSRSALAQESAAASPNAVHVEAIGAWGGPNRAYAAEGDYLFVGQGTGIAVVDVSNPNLPVEVAHFGPLAGMVEHIAVQDHVLYAALGSAGLAILDASTPTALKTLALYAEHAADYVVVDGDRAYVAASRQGFLVLDVGAPAAPARLGLLPLQEWMYAVSLSNQRVYISLGSEGLLVVSVADPAAPQVAAQHPDLRTYRRLEFAGNYAFVIERDGKVHIYDFFEPRAPKAGQVLPTTGGLDIRGRYAYLAGWDGLAAWDVSQPAAPARVWLREDLNYQSWVEMLAGPHALYAVHKDGPIYAFDLANPASPLQTGALTLPQSPAALVALDGSRLVAASDYTLTAYDLSATMDSAGTSLVLPNRATALAACGQKAIVAVSGAQTGLEVVQIAATGEMKRTGVLAVDSPVYRLACSAARVYALQAGRLAVIDMSNPARPREIGSYPVPAGAKLLAVDPPAAYVVDEADTLHIVDVSGPGQPRRLGTYFDSVAFAGIDHIAAGGGHVYLARRSRLDVVEVAGSLPGAASPRLVGTLQPELAVISTLVHLDSHLLVHYGEPYYSTAALHFLDVTDPANPVAGDAVVPPFYGSDLAASAGYVALAGAHDGIVAYWWSPAAQIEVAGDRPVEYSPLSAGATVTYSLDAAQLRPASLVGPEGAGAEAAAAVTVTLSHFQPYLPQAAQAGPLTQVVAPFTLQVSDAASGALLAPHAPVTVAVRLSPDQLSAVDPQTAALFAWSGAAWARLPNSRLDPASGVLTASAATLAPWTVRAAPRVPGKTVYLPYVARPGPDVGLSAFEVTQSTQTLANSVPLVAGKAALARIYAAATGAEPVRDVYLTLSAERDGTALPGSPLQVGPWSVFATWDRGAYRTSFNIPLPLAWSQGRVTLAAELRRGDGAKDADPRNNRAQLSVQFGDVPALDLMIVPVNYIHAPSGKVYPPPSQEHVTDWIARVYPIPGIRVSYHAPVTFQGDLTTNAGFSQAVRLMAEIRKSENPPQGRVYYGVLPLGAELKWGGMGFVGLRASIGTNDGLTAGHEIGHNFGRLHAPCGNPGGPDRNYPYPEASIGQYGFDSGSYTIWTPAASKDFMSYCFPPWTSDYTYLGLLADQLKRGVAAAEAPESRVLWVRAMLHDDGTGEFLPPYSLAGSPDIPPVDAACRVRLVGDAGQTLADHAVPVHEAADGEPLRYASAMLPLPAQPVQAMSLVCDGKEAAFAAIPDAVASASAPQVRPEDGALILQWEAQGAALVQYRRQNDPAWSTLSVDRTEGVLSLAPDTLPGGALQFRVVHAGYAEAVVESAVAAATFDLPDKPPRVWITGPAAVASEASVVLFGHAFDAEDGVLDDLSWFVNGAPAGTGDRLQVTAPASGTVEVTLTATDKAGQTTVAVHRLEGAVAP